MEHYSINDLNQLVKQLADTQKEQAVTITRLQATCASLQKQIDRLKGVHGA